MNSANREVYNRPDVASYYAVLNYLTPCERFLFDLYIKPGMAILDLGVGGGRTTPYLSQRGSRYVGADYASEMIRLCREKYPGLEFVESEASDLSAFASASFDAVVVAFNGLDYVIPDEKRIRCLVECNRVLKPAGVLLFSSHNPRCIFVRPALNRQSIHAAAEALGVSPFIQRILTAPLTVCAWAFACLRAASKSLALSAARISGRPFWRGEGYFMDSAHGGLTTHSWVPERAIAELKQQSFQFETVLANDYPQAGGDYTTGWYYYVFSKL